MKRNFQINQVMLCRPLYTSQITEAVVTGILRSNPSENFGKFLENTPVVEYYISKATVASLVWARLSEGRAVYYQLYFSKQYSWY